MNELIMLVEDETITALDIKRTLEKIGYTVAETITSGEEAVQKAGDIDPDLILMDIFLANEMDGIEAADMIIKTFNKPVIYLSANADSTTIKRADTTKHYGYIIKPVERNHLKSIISTAIKRHKKESGNNN